MKKQKLGLNDFTAVGTSELLKVKGGMTTLLRVDSGGDGGCAEGDPDPFGGTYSMNEVVVTATGPRYHANTTGASATGSVLGQVAQRLLSVPSSFLSTQGLNTSVPYSHSPGYIDPTHIPC